MLIRDEKTLGKGEEEKKIFIIKEKLSSNLVSISFLLNK